MIDIILFSACTIGLVLVWIFRERQHRAELENTINIARAESFAKGHDHGKRQQEFDILPTWFLETMEFRMAQAIDGTTRNPINDDHTLDYYVSRVISNLGDGVHGDFPDNVQLADAANYICLIANHCADLAGADKYDELHNYLSAGAEELPND